MPNLAMLQTVVRELLTRTGSDRVPEPDLVMDNEANVSAYTAAGRDAQLMMQSYMLCAAHIGDAIRPGDTVVDLACGPATLLTLVAEMNPAVRFIGIDLSEGMLAEGRAHTERMGLSNLTFRSGDITSLESIADAGVDAVICTFSLHHLPTVASLGAAFAETRRMLKPGGGLFLFDFARLKSERSIEYFATRHAHLQSDFFTEDYRNTLRAAFPIDDVARQADRHLGSCGKMFRMRPVPLMFAIKGPIRQTEPERLRAELARLRTQLPDYIERDLQDIKMLFRLGGLNTPLLD